MDSKTSVTTQYNITSVVKNHYYTRHLFIYCDIKYIVRDLENKVSNCFLKFTILKKKTTLSFHNFSKYIKPNELI